MEQPNTKTFCVAPWFQIRNENDLHKKVCCSIDKSTKSELGVFEHLNSEANLKLKKDLIKEGFFKNIRNTNYLGEILIYLSFAILSMSSIPLIILAIFFSIVFLPRMIKKDKSLSKYDSFEEYKKKSGLILPKLNAQ